MLYLVSTPIGNLEDITLRAINTLKQADVIICEDTRQIVKLLKHFSIPPKPLISFYEENENEKIADILALLSGDQNVALVSDSGTPLVSDPGYKLVRQAIASNIKVTAIPGPNAAIMALTISGLPPDKFLFLGFLPEKEGHRLAILKNVQTALLSIDATVIVYVSPHKLERQLKGVQEVFGDLQIVLARELTKIYEENWRGTISQALEHFKQPRGEFVLLFSLKTQTVVDGV